LIEKLPLHVMAELLHPMPPQLAAVHAATPADPLPGAGHCAANGWATAISIIRRRRRAREEFNIWLIL
jgi:hypothetical protein